MFFFFLSLFVLFVCLSFDVIVSRASFMELYLTKCLLLEKVVVQL